MGELIHIEGLVPDLILTSTAQRACHTAELVAERSGYKGPIVQTPDLYHAFPEQIASVLGAVDDAHNRIMIVGHNPGLESLVAELSGRYEELPTAALVAIELPIAAWRNLEATGTSPTQVWRPRDL
jgi:phosphohistidine phosphatase